MNYANYYHSTPTSTKGLKPIYGATGLGKTYGIKQFIKQTLLEKRNQKFIYITNRHALIKEMYDSLTNDYKINTVYLKSDIDTLKDLYEDGKLQGIINNLIEDNFFKHSKKFNQNKAEAISFFNSKIQTLENHNNTLKELRGHKILQNEIDKVFSQINKTIKEQFYEFKKRRSQHSQKKILKNNDIWSIYPYAKFENDENTNVCVGTIHKFCMGFFNGKRDLKLHDIEHSDENDNLVIFLDEFDFLEKEMLNILSNEPQLNNTIEFVRFFYEDFENWQKMDFWDKDEGLKFVKNNMESTHNFLSEQIKKYDIDFPTIRRFTFDSDSFLKGNKQRFILFQNNQTTLSESFFLAQKQKRSDAFLIAKQKQENVVSPYVFFSMIKSASEQLLRTFDSIRDRGYLMKEIIDYLWNSKNNNERGSYHKYILENFAYKFKRAANINKADWSKSDFGYYSGFSLITILKESSFDPDIAEVEQIELITSPEAIISQLASKNLVFALSATLDIPRMINCFNNSWLKDHINFITPSKADIELIACLKKIKNLRRQGDIDKQTIKLLDSTDDLERLKIELKLYENNSPKSLCNFFPNEKLSQSHPIYKILKKLKSDAYYETINDINEQSQNKRFERALNFFGCIDWILTKSKNRSHLIFLTSFKNEFAFFEKELQNDIPAIPDIIRKKINKIYDIKKNTFGYTIHFNKTTFNIVFLNSKKVKSIEGDNLPQYDLLFTDKKIDKVIIVTQYATASNGLNLRCLTIDNQETDFEGVHLLEKKHFWFDTSSENYLNNKKKALWYLWKLLQDGQIGYSKFKEYLKQPNLKRFNNLYNSRYEYIFSQVALFYQALGRVDRKRIPVPITEITLGIDVLSIFCSFLTDPNYSENDKIKGRESFTATLILDLHEKLKEYFFKENIKSEFVQSESILHKNEHSQSVIRTLLSEIRKINNGEYTDENDIAYEIIGAWQKIRECVLRQDYDAEIHFSKSKMESINFQTDFVCKTALLKEGKIIHISLPDYKIYHKQFLNGEKIVEWNLKRPFYPIQKNDWLRMKFKEEGLAVKYRKTKKPLQFIYTPYIEQAILRGAIGEEAIKFMLEKNGLFCENENKINISLFELYDAKLFNAKIPIYIDFKNFSEYTLDSFALDKNDWEYREEFNSQNFIQRIISKLLKIRLTTNNNDALYVIINFVGSRNRKTQYFDIHQNELKDFTEADIVVVPSTIYRENHNEISKEFGLFVNRIKNL